MKPINIDYPKLTKKKVSELEFENLKIEAQSKGYTVPPCKHKYNKEDGTALLYFPDYPEHKVIQYPIWKNEKTFKPRQFTLHLLLGDNLIFQCDSLRDIVDHWKKQST